MGQAIAPTTNGCRRPDSFYYLPGTNKRLNFGVLLMVAKPNNDFRTIRDLSNDNKTLGPHMTGHTSLNSLLIKNNTTISYPSEDHQNFRMLLLEHLKINYHPEFEPQARI